MVQQDHPDLADVYHWDEGQVSSPTPPVVPPRDIETSQWTLSEVDWSAMDAMLDLTETRCRAAVQAAGLPDEPNMAGNLAGLSYVIVERDSLVLDGVVNVQVDFSGGARWVGGSIHFSGSGDVLFDYCTIG
jgi:hypothetical protein